MKLKGTGRVLKHSSFPGNKRRITRRPPSVFFERTPETLRKSERKFRTYLENTSDLIVIVDINRIVRYASPSLKRILGYEPEEIVGRMVSFVYPDDAHLLAEPRIQSRLHPGIPMGPLEVRHLHKDGSIRYLELTGTFFIDESGEGYTVMNCRDTTERRLAEDALRIARLQLETATDLTGVVYWEVDEEKKEFVFNDAFYALYATTAEQEGGYRMPVVRLKEFIYPDDLELIDEMAQAMSDPSQDSRYAFVEHRIIRRDGAVRYITSQRRIIRRPDGSIVKLYGVNQDITERKKMEEALRQSETRYRMLAENMSDMIWVLDPWTGRYTYVSPSCLALSGCTAEEIMAMENPLAVFNTNPESAEAAFARLREIREIAATGGQYSRDRLETKGRRRDGSAVWVESRANGVYDETGKLTAIQGISMDITERKRIEEALAKKTEELARSNKELEQFAYIASHDLQEPLRMVASYTELLGKRYTGKLDADADDFIHYAVDGANRMKRLINDLLTYSRVGTQGKPFISVEMKDVVDTAMANLKMAIEDTNARITCDTLPCVLADDVQLLQLFQNLIANAIKFHGEKAPEVHISVARDESDWVVSVKDNGIGIDPKHFERIFQIFQRLHGKREYSGTGIGLAVCKKIVERHGGRLWVESEPGQGSVFMFTIPVMRGNGQ